MTRVQTGYSAIIANVTGDMRQPKWTRKELDSLKRTVIGFKIVLVVTFGEDCGTDLYSEVPFTSSNSGRHTNIWTAI